MSQRHAAEFFKDVQKDQALKARMQAISDPQTFIKIANDHGYSMTEAELETMINQLPESELAAILNPGVGGRQRIVPR
jgi:predicted ribosomally synthesized peptide with nif11-like leader